MSFTPWAPYIQSIHRVISLLVVVHAFPTIQYVQKQRHVEAAILASDIDNKEGAKRLRRVLLEGHPRVHSCHITEAGPALGVHLGVGGIIVGFMPDPHIKETAHA